MPNHALTYFVDGEKYKSYQVEEGTTITPEPALTKEGYTFSGWSEIPETMPDHDVTVTGTFTINKYKLIYKIDDEVYKSYDVEYNSTITAEEAPSKEGYTFSGWSEIPTTMPANDVTITGIFTINKYKLTHIVDGEEYKSYDIEYNSAITPEEEPTKEGYTFSGWSEIPEAMLDHDVTIYGSFTICSYYMYYFDDNGNTIAFTLKYGDSITSEIFAKEGYSYTICEELPATMPAYSFEICISYTINKYKLTYLVDGEIYKTYNIKYGAKITPETEPTKEGYSFSGWSEIPQTMPASDVTVTGSFERRYDVGNVASLIGFILRGNGGNEDLALYDMNGDGELNIGDLILILKNVLKNTNRSAATRAVVECLAPDLTQYTAAQFVLNVPIDVNEQDIQLVKSIKQSHQMMCRQIEPGVYAVVVYSLTNKLLAPENGGIIEVNTRDVHSDELTIQDVVLAKPTGETKRFEYMPVTTSISDVERDDNLRSVYDMKGQKQSRTDGLRKGIYIENGKKTVVR